MENLIEGLRSASAPAQALAVTVGGLVGVFLTLFVFWAMIAISERFGKRE